jgi:hypothetical protein
VARAVARVGWGKETSIYQKETKARRPEGLIIISGGFLLLQLSQQFRQNMAD